MKLEAVLDAIKASIEEQAGSFKLLQKVCWFDSLYFGIYDCLYFVMNDLLTFTRTNVTVISEHKTWTLAQCS